MLITKLKTYPKHSQTGGYGGGSTSTGSIQTNLYTSGGEYQLADGTEYIGDYHIHPTQGAMVGATHPRSPHPALFPYGGVAPTPSTTLVQRDPSPGIASPALPPPYVPTLAELSEYEKYIVSGSTYKSNLEFINNRDTKGNISLSESGSNQELLFESIADNYTNRSVVSAINTQFNYFKFPATITTEIQDIEFDESLLDIDVQQGILNDPYQGSLIRNQADPDSGIFFVQGLGKRSFQIKADSIWAIKNALPPFSNINDDIDDLDAGESNYNNYNGVTVRNVSAGIFNGYDILESYGPDDGFAEGNVYAKINVRLIDNTQGNLQLPSTAITPPYFVEVIGPKFGKAEWSDVTTDTFNTPNNPYKSRFRFAEFDAVELQDSFIRINSNLPTDQAFILDNPRAFTDFDNTDIYGPPADLLEIAAYLQNIYNIDITNIDGTPGGTPADYFNFVQDAFRDWARGIGNWDIEQYAKRDKKPKNFLDGLISPGAPGNNNNWGTGINYYKITPGNLGDEDDKTRMYRLRLSAQTSQGAGYNYELFLNDTNVTSQLKDINNDIATNLVENAINTGVQFKDNQNTGNGYSLSFNDLSNELPNGIVPNSVNNLEIKINTGASNSNSGDIYIYFVGLNRMSGNDATTPNSSLNSWSLQVVPNSIILETPASDIDGSKIFDANEGNSFVNANKLKNVGALFPPIIGYFASVVGVNTNEYLVFDTNWTSDTPIRFIS